MAGRTTVKKSKDGKIIEIVHSDYFDGYEPDNLFDLDSFRLTEDIINKALKEAKNNNFYITVRTEPGENPNYTFKKVKGTKLNSEYFAYKSDISGFGYSITDIASGLAIVTKIPTVKACKEYLAGLTDEDRAKIIEVRQKPHYQEVCKKLAEFIVNDDSLDQDFSEPED